MLTAAHEAVIRDAALAQRAYHRMLRDVDDNTALQRAMMLRRVDVDAELRGERSRAPAPLHLSLADATTWELEGLRPELEQRIARERAQRRVGHGCGPVQLRVSYAASARQKLRAIAKSLPFSLRELAAYIGYASSTLERHLRGDSMSHERRDWYERLERIEIRDSEIALVVRRLPPTRITCRARTISDHSLENQNAPESVTRARVGRICG